MADIKEEWDESQNPDIMKEALGILDDLKSYAVSNKEIIEEYATRTGIEADVLKKYRSYRLTEGRGVDTADPLEKSEDKVSHPDIVAAACRKLWDVISVYHACGEQTRLEPYLNALKRAGISISVNIPTHDTTDDLDDFIALSRENTHAMWGLDQHLKEDLAPSAEEEGIAPAKKFSEIARLQYAITYGRGKTQKMEERIEHEKDLNIMHNDALTSL